MASVAAGGLFRWLDSVIKYHNIAKAVNPKIDALRVAEAELQSAQSQLAAAEKQQEDAEKSVASLEAGYQLQVTEKKRIEEATAEIQRKTDKANALIHGEFWRFSFSSSC